MSIIKNNFLSVFFLEILFDMIKIYAMFLERVYYV